VKYGSRLLHIIAQRDQTASRRDLLYWKQRVYWHLIVPRRINDGVMKPENALEMFGNPRFVKNREVKWIMAYPCVVLYLEVVIGGV